MKKSRDTREYYATVNYNKGYDLQESGDIEGAVSAYEIAAKFGAADAMSRLGTIYADEMKPRNPELAVYWYKRGVKSGDAGCAWNLAMHYAGMGSRRWYIYWLRVAQRMGEGDAEVELKNEKWWIKKNIYR